MKRDQGMHCHAGLLKRCTATTAALLESRPSRPLRARGAELTGPALPPYPARAGSRREAASLRHCKTPSRRPKSLGGVWALGAPAKRPDRDFSAGTGVDEKAIALPDLEGAAGAGCSDRPLLLRRRRVPNERRAEAAGSRSAARARADADRERSVWLWTMEPLGVVDIGRPRRRWEGQPTLQPNPLRLERLPEAQRRMQCDPAVNLDRLKPAIRGPAGLGPVSDPERAGGHGTEPLLDRWRPRGVARCLRRGPTRAASDRRRATGGTGLRRRPGGHVTVLAPAGCRNQPSGPSLRLPPAGSHSCRELQNGNPLRLALALPVTGPGWTVPL